MPSAPDHFKYCSAINAKGPTLVKDLPIPKGLSSEEFSKLKEKGYTILDIRRYIAFLGAHIKGSYNIDIFGNLPTFAGWIIPYDKPILLVGDNKDEIDQAIVQLRWVGLDQIIGYLEDSVHSWAIKGFPIDYINSISALELKEKLDKNEVVVLDVRSKLEYESFHIEKAINIHFPDLRTRYNEIEKNKLVAVL